MCEKLLKISVRFVINYIFLMICEDKLKFLGGVCLYLTW